MLGIRQSIHQANMSGISKRPIQLYDELAGINLEQEYKNIKEKKSKLSSALREKVVKRMESRMSK